MFSRDAAGPDLHWERLVEREPYFAVLTSPKYPRANLKNASEREFFDSGEKFVGIDDGDRSFSSNAQRRK